MNLSTSVGRHLVALLCLVAGATTASSLNLDSQCRYQLREHRVLTGVGLFASKNFSQGEVIDRCVGVIVPDTVITGHLNKYFFAHTEEGFSVMALGICMLFNHNSGNANARILRPDYPDPVPHPRLPAGTILINAIVDRNVRAGEELFTDYGYDEGFWGSAQAGVDYIDATAVAAEWDSFTTIPGCHSIMTEILGGRVYATQYIHEGDLIEISRALFVPVQFAMLPNLTQYVWMEEHSDFSLTGIVGAGMVMLGHGSLYQPAADPEQHNVRYEWYTYDERKNGTFFWEDLVLEHMGMVAFVASRDIDVNEELTVPLRVDAVTGRRNVLNQMLPRRLPLGEHLGKCNFDRS